MDGNGAAFEEQFIMNSKKQPFLKKQDRFDGKETVIKVGNLTFNFDQGDEIFDLSAPCKESLKARGMKMKDVDIKNKHCQVCQHELVEKKTAQCDFCALFGCTECVYKQFPFPVQENGGQ